MANSWRMSGDIYDSFDRPEWVYHNQVLRIIADQGYAARVAPVVATKATAASCRGFTVQL